LTPSEGEKGATRTVSVKIGSKDWWHSEYGRLKSQEEFNQTVTKSAWLTRILRTVMWGDLEIQDSIKPNTLEKIDRKVYSLILGAIAREKPDTLVCINRDLLDKAHSVLGQALKMQAKPSGAKER
jgi:hypothetical protein